MSQPLEASYLELITSIKRSGLKVDIEKIHAAWEFAKLAHGDQMRKSGDLYITHPLAAAKLVVSWKLDEDSIVAALLHDTIEDGGATHADLVEKFGASVALLVDGVTNVADLRLRGSEEERFTENLRKMVLFMAKDIRVVLIKLADRLHNMQTLFALPEVKQRRIAKETLEVYAPLAERLGMGKVKGELEDLAFKYFYKEDYEKLIKSSGPFFKAAEQDIKNMKQTLYKNLSKNGINAVVNGRKKHIFSLWNKLKRDSVSGDFEKVHDIVALRVLVDSIEECYSALGIIHTHYKPVSYLGISDFIAQPKPNGYRSIHTKVFGPHGRIVEVQVRTHQMHEEAENGIAAHWAYAQAKAGGMSDKVLEHQGVKVEADKLGWVKQLVEWQKEITDSKEFLSAVKFDALNHRNFVFSPKGDVYDLPSGATPIDFAFNVHTKLGQFIQGAKVNGKIVPLHYKLKSGDVVEILKSKNPKLPNRDWLNFAATTTAKREIGKRLRRKTST